MAGSATIQEISKSVEMTDDLMMDNIIMEINSELEATEKNLKPNLCESDNNISTIVLNLVENDATQNQSLKSNLCENDNNISTIVLNLVENDATQNESSQNSQNVVTVIEYATMNNAAENVVTRKRPRKFNEWKVNVRKLKHQAGEEYINYRGKNIPKKEIKTTKDCLNNCKLNCSKNISQVDREILFKQYYQFDQQRKHDFILKYTARTLTNRNTIKPHENRTSRRSFTFSYYLELSGSKYKVCKQFWLGTFGISQQPVYNVHKKKCSTTDSAQSDKRGKTGVGKKISDDIKGSVVSHINSFPCTESHYCRSKTKKKYLDPNLNIRKMFELYVEQNENSVKESYYRYIFTTMFNLGFHIPKTDRCGTCEMYQITLKHNNILSEDATIHFENHSALKTKMREQRQIDRENSIPVLCFDLQNVITCPRSQIGPLFYYSKLNIYNLRACLSTTKKTYCALWTEYTAGRTGNDLASALMKILERVVEDNDITELITWSDSCVPQNKNSIMCAAIKYFLESHPSINKITMKFSVAGHSANQEVDKIHSDIEKVLAVNDFFSPMGLIKILKTVNRKNPLIILQMNPSDFKDYGKFGKEKFNFTHVPFSKLNMLQFNQHQFEIKFCEGFSSSEFATVCVRIPQRTLKKKRFVSLIKTPDIISKAGELSATKEKHLIEMFKYMAPCDIEYFKVILKLGEYSNPEIELTATAAVCEENPQLVEEISKEQVIQKKSLKSKGARKLYEDLQLKQAKRNNRKIIRKTKPARK